MEERIDEAVPLVKIAGTDPAYVPGLTLPGVAGSAAAVPDARSAPSEKPGDADGAGAEAGDTSEQDSEGAAAEAEDAAADADPWDEETEFDFEASDRRGQICAGAAGIRFRLGEDTAAFGWAEIGAVEIATPRWGREFSVTVYTRDRRRFEGQVDAPSRGRLRQWESGFDAVLDAHFED